MTAASRDVADPAVHHVVLDGQVEDILFRTVVDAGEFGLLALLADDLEFLDHLGGQVLGGHRRVVLEEGLAADGDLVDGLAVDGDRAVIADFDARELLQQVFQHVVLRGLEGFCVILDGVLLDDDRVADIGDAGRFEGFRIDLQLDGPEIQVVLGVELDGLGERFVAKKFRLDLVRALAHAFKGTCALFVGEDILVRIGPARDGQGHGGKADRLSGGGVLELDLDVLSECAGAAQRHGEGKNELPDEGLHKNCTYFQHSF